MLQTLFLRDFVIVDQAEIDFQSGFCALSGETGAGKSILLDALGLALGGRSDVSVVRAGARRAEITASFVPSADVQTWLQEHDLANEEDHELLMRRTVDADGKSRSFINGSPVKLAQLRSLGAQVLEIHGQHASQSLLRNDGQRELLDSVSSLGDATVTVAVDWKQWQSASKTLAEATGHHAELSAERERLTWQLEEIDALDLAAGEWESLSGEQTRLANASELIGAARNVMEALSETDNAVDERLASLIGHLQQGARIDKQLDNVVDLLESARIQVAEAASDLGSYLDGVEADPARLELVEQRVSAVFRLARKMTIEPGELHTRAGELRERLNELQRAQDLAQLEQEVQRLQSEYQASADKLTALRRRGASQLAKAVNQHLDGLGMPNARFDITVNAVNPGPHGADQVEFQFAGHNSIDLRPLAKVASGGELSRISLAIAVSAATANPVQSLIFDEADAGVGGSVADAIGLLMRTLGDSRQVLAVTHLPQVAARAHHHYQVSKRSRGSAISSSVTLLDDKERVDEVARMLGGARITATTRQHAVELLDMGRRDNNGKAGKNTVGKATGSAKARTGKSKAGGKATGKAADKTGTARKTKTSRAARAT